jgi:hypothetical protein
LSPAALKLRGFGYEFQGQRLTLAFGTYKLYIYQREREREREAREKLIDVKRSLISEIDPRLRKNFKKEA